MNMDIHDFEITSVRTSGRSAFELNLVDVRSAESYVMNFTNVRKLYVDGFSLQNIVLDLSVYAVPSSAFGFQRACGMLDLGQEEAELALKSGSLVLIEAASGAEIACLLGDKVVPNLVRVSVVPVDDAPPELP
ncbi:hypothetical protein J7J08_04835 [Stenotrophomonas sp. ISL-67]|uniref:hypothetical protein n=1 Tax=Stenotrophomonas sp. ISL-67 TaxID=2819171 RepID=UPI001BE83D97|nr:hypothetical protein [Stenotrophomonas sp. ISL-67]MBT2766952.1 hypothetical protein [Stenotrophomonas sp. ISL-67]